MKHLEQTQLQNQKGFTLVEIAIVLVIIGLLLGGVLKGQEMINSAKIKSDTDTLVALQAATYAYRDRMGYYPGTLRAATPTDATLDGNQIVRVATASDAGKTAIVANIGDYFVDVAIQEFIKDPNMAPKLDEAGKFSVGYAEDGTTAGAGSAVAGTAPAALRDNKNYICMSYTADITNAEDVIRGIDIKLDDGNPDTGKVRTSVDTACLEI